MDDELGAAPPEGSPAPPANAAHIEGICSSIDNPLDYIVELGFGIRQTTRKSLDGVSLDELDAERRA